MITFFILFSLFLLFYSNAVFAIRPFVTDDARILSIGQVGSEIWLEEAMHDSNYDFTQHALLSWNAYKWIEVTAVGNFHHKSGRMESFNPVLQAKLLLTKAGREGEPGLALSTANVFNSGTGTQKENAQASYLLGLSTLRLNQDRLIIHANLGVTQARPPNEAKKTRPFWGIGFDRALWALDWRVIGEVYSGDPYSAFRSPVAAQTGFRWLYHHQFSFDLVMGGQPEYNEHYHSTGENEYWVQLGVRISADLYTETDDAPSAHGAGGIFR
jgi:hypothetical protein